MLLSRALPTVSFELYLSPCFEEKLFETSELPLVRILIFFNYPDDRIEPLY